MSYWLQLQTLLLHSPTHAKYFLQKTERVPPLADENVETLLNLAEKQSLRRQVCMRVLAGASQDGPFTCVPHERSERLVVGAFPELKERTWKRCTLLYFPLPVVQGETGRLIPCLAGQVEGPGEQPPVLHHLGPGSREHCLRVFRFLSTVSDLPEGYLFAPLLAKEDPGLSGASFCLPLALALKLLSEGTPWPETLYSSGNLTKDGKILPVAHMREKAAALKGAEGFIVPSENLSELGEHPWAYGCNTFPEASEVVRLFRQDLNIPEIRKHLPLLQNPETVLAFFSELPLPLLRSPRCQEIFSDIRKRPALLTKLVQTLNQVSYDRVRAEMLVKLFPPEELKEIKQTEPEELDAILAWCQAVGMAANHWGELGLAEQWTALRAELLGEEGDSDQLDTLNNQFITERLNRYHFSLTIPARLEKALKQREAGVSQQNPIPDRALGALYGTLCQNAGFCGSRGNEDFVLYIKRANTTFGKRYLKECRRLQVYQIYHLLDRHKYEDIPPLLNSLLSLVDGSGKELWFQQILLGMQKTSSLEIPFKVTVAARVMADLECQVEGPAFDKLREGFAELQGGELSHPWQLTFLNLGRVAAVSGRTHLAEALFRKMIAVCQSGGAAMKVMALLGAAELHRLGAADEAILDVTRCCLDKIRAGGELNRQHFERLLLLTCPVACLEFVLKNKQSIFPFSYR